MIYKVSMAILSCLTFITMGLYIMGDNGLYPILMFTCMWSLACTHFMFSKKHYNKWAGIIAYVGAFMSLVVFLKKITF